MNKKNDKLYTYHIKALALAAFCLALCTEEMALHLSFNSNPSNFPSRFG